ncbi:hypothetical protein CQR45_1846 [Bifidobacterium pseudolongum subsp. globosum]|uniref:Uncharacterized protein n=1 Tax=Bifidobacterium pseudolongum subsp. globosum TaxID=1690 RepID=A0A2N3QLS8_9BIFI|nr:hypothetical protein CQR45_1846 [Bifidobacterium pseudolongum subsp. globosum]
MSDVSPIAVAGIIPALAGNTRTSGGPRRPSGDHPRACGEHPGDVLDASRGMGSSPRLRGTPTALSLAPCRGGIIPALAGNTRMSATVVTSSWDHPRACGEHPATGATRSMARGSSPRLRGTLTSPTKRTGGRGIIPALAGNTSVSSHCGYPRGDHPRACGEHVRVEASTVEHMGSSPRLRGTPPTSISSSRARRIIPALAGNTNGRFQLLHVHVDHPRACGEHSTLPAPYPRTLGSSPRLRGTQPFISSLTLHVGIIPALAGNTRWTTSRLIRGRDHPRACGEHEELNRQIDLSTGSSPRLRGTHGA